MSFFDRKKVDQDKEQLAARISQVVSQSTSPAAAPPDASEEVVEVELAKRAEESSPAIQVEYGEDERPGPATNEFAALAPPPGASRFTPTRPESIEDTGLSLPFITDLLLRALYQAHELTGAGLAERTALPFANVVGPIIESLRHDQAVEVKAQRGIGDAGYLYGITEKGLLRARESMEMITYAGPAPVPLADYVRAVLAQSVRNVVVTEDNIRAAFQDLVINDSVFDEVGPAVNSGASMFLFGYPGNGKTSIAERITKLLGDYIFVPYAVEVDGAIITVFDAINHTPYEEKASDGQPVRRTWDSRWVKIERPVVMVGGELTMSSLDLLFNEQGKYYEAPLQMKANGGMFLIDDFGRQMIRPQDLLNRWIVPLEKRVDFLTLATGKKIVIPFEQLIVFSTNLDPKALVDDAFLRRIKFKINVSDPDEDQYRQIFTLMCDRRNVAFDEDAFQYVLETYYKPFGRPLRMCEPRDIIDQIISIAKYKMVPPQLTHSLIDRACKTYFVSVNG